VLQFVKYIRKKLPSLPIIAVGGIQHGLNVFELIQAGANLVQVYSALVYEGPLLVRHSNLELREFMRNQEADFRRWSPKVKRE
jgi:dihydroorotate dehydrogenase